MRPIISMVTDRTRFSDRSTTSLVAAAHAAASAGVQLIQIRERDLDGRALLELTRRVMDAVRHTSARVLVNERLDVALAAHAHGVHLRASSFPPSRVRRAVPQGFLIGRSIHSASEAAAMSGEGADYLLFGNVFDTPSKPDTPGVGIDALAAAVEATPLPVLGLGGVTEARVPALMAAGAAGFAAISMFARGGE